MVAPTNTTFTLSMAHDLRKYFQTRADTVALHHGSDKQRTYVDLRQAPVATTQTEQGIVLSVIDKWPEALYTPSGIVKIFDGASKCDDCGKTVLKLAQEDLKLVPQTTKGVEGLPEVLFAVTNWGGQVLETPVYRDNSQLLSQEKITAEWQTFIGTKGTVSASTHSKCSIM